MDMNYRPQNFSTLRRAETPAAMEVQGHTHLRKRFHGTLLKVFIFNLRPEDFCYFPPQDQPWCSTLLCLQGALCVYKSFYYRLLFIRYSHS